MVEFIRLNWEWLIPATLVLLEAVTRLTPTEKDDGLVKRLGTAIDYVMDNLKVPNRKK